MCVSVCAGGEHVQLSGDLLNKHSKSHTGTIQLRITYALRVPAERKHDVCVLQIVLETDRQALSFSVMHIEDLEAMVSHMTASLKRIFPDSSPGWVSATGCYTSECTPVGSYSV